MKKIAWREEVTENTTPPTVATIKQTAALDAFRQRIYFH
jgi:hypothetical protein